MLLKFVARLCVFVLNACAAHRTTLFFTGAVFGGARLGAAAVTSAATCIAVAPARAKSECFKGIGRNVITLRKLIHSSISFQMWRQVISLAIVN